MSELTAETAYRAGPADAAATSPHAELRIAGAVLDGALEELGGCLRNDFGAAGQSRVDVIAAFARDHS